MTVAAVVFVAEAEARGEENQVMGLLRTAVTIRNPADRTRSWQGNFLVDTGRGLPEPGPR